MAQDVDVDTARATLLSSWVSTHHRVTLVRNKRLNESESCHWGIMIILSRTWLAPHSDLQRSRRPSRRKNVPHSSDTIVRRLRSMALQTRTLNLSESRSIDTVANSLRDLFATDGDLLNWIKREEHLERAAEHAVSLLCHRVDDAGRDLATVIGELGSTIRGTRTATLRRRFPHLSEQLIAAPVSALRDSII
jgi:hypothetical protein